MASWVEEMVLSRDTDSFPPVGHNEDSVTPTTRRFSRNADNLLSSFFLIEFFFFIYVAFPTFYFTIRFDGKLVDEAIYNRSIASDIKYVKILPVA